MNLSTIGKKLSARSGILELMDDLGNAMTINPDMYMLGGGNPASIPAVEKIWRQQINRLLLSGDEFEKTISNYDPPQGNPRFLDSFAALFRTKFGWPITAENVAVSNGAQTGVFCLLNMLAGIDEKGNKKKILVPLSPDYVGYADMGLSEELFISSPGIITTPDSRHPEIFKYTVDIPAVENALIHNSVAVMLISRPTNPTGNVISDDQLLALDKLAEKYNVPLIIDNAYGLPFPAAVEQLQPPFYSPRIIETFSLSKIGLPGLRTAFIIGSKPLIKALSGITAIVGLANGNFGQRLTEPLFESGEILNISQQLIQPFYSARRRQAIEMLADNLNQTGVSWKLHQAQGAFFLWLWLPELKITSEQLYQRLKENGVLVIPGENFFYGKYTQKVSPEFATHQTQCLRISFTASPSALEKGIKIIAQQAGKACS